jgi:hypothetical protein
MINEVVASSQDAIEAKNYNETELAAISSISKVL